MEVKEIIFFTLVIIFSLLLSIFGNVYPFPNTDINQNLFFSELLLKNKTLKFTNELNLKYGLIFGFRGFLNFGKDYFVPSILPGLLLLTTLFKLLNIPLIFINVSASFLCLLFFYLIGKNFLFKNKNKSLITSLLFFFSGPFFYLTAFLFKDLMATALFFASLFAFLKGIKNERWLILFGIFSSLAIWFNYANVIFFAPFFLIYKKEFFKAKKILLALVPFVILIAPLIFYHFYLYGGLFNFNKPLFSLNYPEFYKERKGVGHFLISINFKDFVKNLLFQLIFVNPLLIFLAFFGVKRKKIYYLLLSILFIQLVLFFSKEWSGAYLIGSIGTTYARYFLISYGLLCFMATNGIEKLARKELRPIIVLFLLFFGLFLSFFSTYGIKDIIEVSIWTENLREKIEVYAKPNSIFFVGFYDKYIFPNTAAIYGSIEKEHRLNKTVGIIEKLVEDGYNVYLVNESYMGNYSFSNYALLLEKRGLAVRREFDNFFKIEKNETKK